MGVFKRLSSLALVLASIAVPATVSMDKASAAEMPATKTFYPVGYNNQTKTWSDGVPIGPTGLKIDSAGLITGFAKDQTGQEWNGQKFKSTDGFLAYCLNFNQGTPNGTSSQINDLTADQKQKLENLMKLGYVEDGTTVYKGEGVKTLSNIDAFTATQWVVHELIPTYDMSQFTVTNPQLEIASQNLRSWINDDLSLKLVDKGTVDGNVYVHRYSVAAPHSLTGKVKLTLGQDIAGAKVQVNGQTYDISATEGPTVDVPAEFDLSVPETTTGDVILKADGGTYGFDIAKYDRPQIGQQQALGISGRRLDNSEHLKTSFYLQAKPSIGTTATNKADGSKTVQATKDVTIVDQVAYKNLTVGKEYTVSGKLMDKSTGKALLVNGKEVTASKTFTASKADGTIKLDFTFDASGLGGKDLVVFESLTQAGKEVASHADLTDKGQTVTVEKPVTPTPEAPKPSIATTATNKADGSKTVKAEKNVTIVDQVAYKNLTVGKEYTVSGKLMDKSTGKALLVNGKEVTASKTFTASKADGTIKLDFTFDASGLDGKDLVVFESLTQAGKEVASHADLTDKGQTVTVEKPVTPTPEAPVENKSLQPTKNVKQQAPKQDDKKHNTLGLPNTGEEQTLWISIVGALLLVIIAMLTFRYKRSK